MARPDTVKIGAHNYRIECRDMVYDRDEDQRYLGRITYQDGEILIDADAKRSPSQIAETFLHEVVHGISNDRDLELDERQVDQVAAGLLAVMVDNPDIFGVNFVDRWQSE